MLREAHKTFPPAYFSAPLEHGASDIILFALMFLGLGMRASSFIFGQAFAALVEAEHKPAALWVYLALELVSWFLMYVPLFLLPTTPTTTLRFRLFIWCAGLASGVIDVALEVIFLRYSSGAVFSPQITQFLSATRLWRNSIIPDFLTILSTIREQEFTIFDVLRACFWAKSPATWDAVPAKARLDMLEMLMKHIEACRQEQRFVTPGKTQLDRQESAQNFKLRLRRNAS